jgi:asparagine synthase (glutamine-hydrolysing)
MIKRKESEILLGHNRLSIIDLSEKAHQPMWDHTGRFCIVFNGEIYNYIELRQQLQKNGFVFNTHSDTEVILNAFAYFGIDALQYFKGPFAFALFDTEREELWLCRDRFGVRPLYYIEMNHTLYFASSSNVLAKHLHLKPNMDYLAKGLHYLVYEDGTEISPYEKLLSLKPGCYLQAKLNSNGVLVNQLTQYYHLNDHVENTIQHLSTINDRDLLPLVANELEKSVEIRMRSDVPFAISLSGGLDSSSIASLVSQKQNNLLGFSFSHPNEKKTEGPIVANCGNFLKIQIEYVWPTAKEMIEGLFKTLTVQEAPFSSLSIVAQYLLYQRVRSFGIKILLGGQGGDESFMGYKKFLIFEIKNLIRQKNYLKAFQQMTQLTPMFFAELPSLRAYWQHRHRYLNRQQDQTVLNLPYTPLNLSQIGEDLWQRQSLDILHFTLPTLLRYEDRNAMGHSVESRLPYMDHQLVELGLALPKSLKLRHGFGKWAIREIMQNKLPDNIRLARYKRGFDIPMNTLLKAGLGAEIRMHLKNHASAINDYFKSHVNIDHHYSDRQLLQRRSAMSEVITLLWLSNRLI